VLGLSLHSAQNIFRLLKLPAHAGLREIHEVLGVIHNRAVDDVVPHPGMQAQRACLAVIIAPVMSNIEVNLVGQPLDFPLWAHAIIVHKKQIDVRGSPQ
jgi:hypothetical protein